MKYRNDLWLFSMIRIRISKMQTYNVHELVDCAATAVESCSSNPPFALMYSIHFKAQSSNSNVLPSSSLSSSEILVTLDRMTQVISWS